MSDLKFFNLTYRETQSISLNIMATSKEETEKLFWEALNDDDATFADRVYNHLEYSESEISNIEEIEVKPDDIDAVVDLPTNPKRIFDEKSSHGRA